MSISVQNGQATIGGSVLYGVFLGSSCMEGVFPPVGQHYSKFSFQPKQGTRGVLVFQKQGDENKYDFYPYFWGDEKLFVQYSHQYEPTNAFSESTGSGEFGLMTQYGSRIFVTNIPKDAGDVEYRLVDPMTMVRFIDGKISRRQLARAAQIVRAKAKKDEGLQAQIEELKNRLGLYALADKFDMRSTTIVRLEGKLKDRNDFLFDLHTNLVIGSGWPLRLAMTKEQKKTLRRLTL